MSRAELVAGFEKFTAALNDPALDVPEVARRVRDYRSLILWMHVAGLCDSCVGELFEQVVYNNLWVEPASLASRRIDGWLDSLFAGAL